MIPMLGNGETLGEILYGLLSVFLLVWLLALSFPQSGVAQEEDTGPVLITRVVVGWADGPGLGLEVEGHVTSSLFATAIAHRWLRFGVVCAGIGCGVIEREGWTVGGGLGVIFRQSPGWHPFFQIDAGRHYFPRPEPDGESAPFLGARAAVVGRVSQLEILFGIRLQRSSGFAYVTDYFPPDPPRQRFQEPSILGALQVGLGIPIG
jgi:hypothetical protein